MEHATVAKTGSLLQSGLTSLYNDAADGSGKMISLSQVRTLEKKLAKRLGEGVERLGVIIKDLAKAQRRLDTRTSNLELKVLGATNTSAHGGSTRDASARKKKSAVTSTAKGSAEILTQSGKGGSKKTATGTTGAKTN